MLKSHKEVWVVVVNEAWIQYKVDGIVLITPRDHGNTFVFNSKETSYCDIISWGLTYA